MECAVLNLFYLIVQERNEIDFYWEGLGSIVQTLFDGNVESMRDNLYLSVYAMEMFSYATYENEGKYHLLEKNPNPSVDVKTLTKSNYPGKYDSVNDKWMDESPKVTYNKSLTNKMINVTNNAAMGAEVEYILYGKDSNAENVKAAYADIAAIRGTLNTRSTFPNFWMPNKNPTAGIIESISNGLSAATGGMIPAMAIKVVILALLVAFETCNDLNRLAAGFPVELYKSDSKYWQYSLGAEESSISDIMNKLSSFGQGFNNEEATGLFYSDYLTLFVLLGFQGDKSEDMARRMAEVIQANMQKLTNNTDYSMGNAKVYFQLDAKLKVDPLLITIPLFNQYNGGYDSSNTDWCTYQKR